MDSTLPKWARVRTFSSRIWATKCLAVLKDLEEAETWVVDLDSAISHLTVQRSSLRNSLVLIFSGTNSTMEGSSNSSLASNKDNNNKETLSTTWWAVSEIWVAWGTWAVSVKWATLEAWCKEWEALIMISSKVDSAIILVVKERNNNRISVQIWVWAEEVVHKRLHQFQL